MRVCGTGALIALALTGIVTPADGAVLATPPAEVSVAIPSGGVREAHLTVATSAGEDVTAGPPFMREGKLVVALRAVADGTYLVAFHFVLPDGRVDAGVTRFGVGVDPAGGSSAHLHSGSAADPLHLVLTVVAAALVVASLYILLSPSSRRRPDTPSRR